MKTVKHAYWRPVLAVGVAVAALAAATPAAAAPTPPGQVQVQAAAAEATYTQKLAVAVKFGRGDDNALLEKGDRDFVIDIWNGVKNDPNQAEVRVAAVRAFAATEATESARLSYEFIVTEAFAAYDRDVDRERTEADAKRAGDAARSAASASIDVVADAALLNGTDADFVRLIWERVADDPKWLKVKAAAQAARNGSDADRIDFIMSGMAEAARQDVDDRIREDIEEDLELQRAKLARAAKKQAANRILMPVTDELLNLPDRDFVTEVWNFAPDDSEVQAAAIAALRQLDPAAWKAYIDTGIHAAKDRDIQIALDRAYAADKALAAQIKAAAAKAGDLNLVWWTDKALAGSATQLADFLRVGQYDLNLSTSFEAGQVQPTWSDTPAWANAVVNVSPICCSLKGPELGVRSETGHTGSKALMYSGIDKDATRSYAYLKTMAVSRITVKADTRLTYWVFPQTNQVRSEVNGVHSRCVGIDLVFSDGGNLRDSAALTNIRNIKAHPAQQCNALVANQWQKVEVDLGKYLLGKQITTLVVGYDRPAGKDAAYRGLIDDISIHSGPRADAR